MATRLLEVVTAILYLSQGLVLCHSEIVDLTHPMDNTSLYWPNGLNFQLDITDLGQTDNYWYQGDQSCSGTHVGTHMDAPAHFFKDKWAVDEVPASRLVAPGVVVDIRTRAAEEPNSNVTLADVTAWEAEHGQIPPAAIVIMCSGWADKYPDRAAVFGNDRDDSTDFHFPGFGVDAVGWLIEERGIVGLGVDSPSTDFGASTLFPSHVMAAEHNVYGLENMNRVCDIPPAGTMIYALPAMYKGASGAPTRILAIWDNNTSRAGSHRCTGLLASWALIVYYCLMESHVL